MSEEFIGSGWAFPLRTDPTGRIALVSREQEIEESIRLILGTAIGERPMRPEFGCRIHDYIFASADGATASAIAFEVREAIRLWEPRVDVDDIAVTFDAKDPAGSAGAHAERTFPADFKPTATKPANSLVSPSVSRMISSLTTRRPSLSTAARRW